MVWGSDLATVAISMDFAALAIWVHHAKMFPFFSRLNSESVSRELHVWFIVIGVHFFFLLVSLVLKHNHGRAIVGLRKRALIPSLAKTRLGLNSWMIAANSTGFISLLTSIVVFTNAL